MRDLPTRFAAFGEMPADRKCNELESGPSDASTGLLKFVAADKRKKSAGVKRENFGSRAATALCADETSRKQGLNAIAFAKENFRLGALFFGFAKLRLGLRQGFRHRPLKPEAFSGTRCEAVKRQPQSEHSRRAAARARETNKASRFAFGTSPDEEVHA